MVNGLPDNLDILLVEAATEIAVKFRTDPKVAALIDPAVFIYTDEQGHVIYRVIEHLQLIEVMSPIEAADGRRFVDKSREIGIIAVLVTDENGTATYSLPDPRAHPNAWPWLGLEDDEDWAPGVPY